MPFAFTAFYFLINAASVIVNNYFIPLPVPFAWGKDHCSGIFQHRDKVRHYKRLGKQVFVGTKQVGTLPFPSPFCILEVFSMTLPKGYVLSFQSLVDDIGAGYVLNPRITFVCLFPQTGLVFLFAEVV